MTLETLDARDRRILNLLQDNGRLSNAELAEQVNLSRHRPVCGVCANLKKAA